jgi:hypothetical protein
MLISGTKLTAAQRRQVLAAFTHRHTVENAEVQGGCLLCKLNGPADRLVEAVALNAPPIPWHEYHIAAENDERWITTHAFYFVKDGSRLMANRRHAEPIYMADDYGE